MTIEREKGSRFITFICDDNNCHEIFLSSYDDFGLSLSQAKEKGWKVRKVCGEWMHFCRDCQP